MQIAICKERKPLHSVPYILFSTQFSKSPYRITHLYAMFLLALLEYYDPPPKVTVVLSDKSEMEKLPLAFPLETAVILREPSAEYPLKNGATTFYVCQGHSCLPPINELPTL